MTDNDKRCDLAIKGDGDSFSVYEINNGTTTLRAEDVIADIQEVSGQSIWRGIKP